MTEPKKPKSDPQTWPAAELPILTDVDDGAAAEGVEIPEFDFSNELDQMASTLDTPQEAPLEFPPELSLDDALQGTDAHGEGTIDFDRLPSLDLDGELAQAGSEFEFELEPISTSAPDSVELDTTVAHAEFDTLVADAQSGTPEGRPDELAELGAQIPELTLDDVLPEPSSSDTLAQDAPSPELASQFSAIPELILDNVLGAVAHEQTPMLDDLPVLEEEQVEPLMEVSAAEPEVDDTQAMAQEALEAPALANETELAPPGEPPVDDAPSGGEPFRSISLDSLPRGVLGGGRALAEAEADDSGPSVQDLIRAAERTLAQEQLKQATPLPAFDAAVPAQATPAQVADPTAGNASARPVEIINVAGLASSPAPQSFNLPPVRKSYVTLVDEAMLIDSLYDKILPRMKVELSLWLQDALDHQTKQMLSGVMHQLKEDYEMLFSETLRDSLRQAIAEMGRADRGERY